MADTGDEGFMRRAVALAQAGERRLEGPTVGCVIVLDGHVIGEGTHVLRRGYDPAAHAEVLALRRAGEAVRGWEIPGAVLYSTLQPCGLCIIAGIWAKVGRIVFGVGPDDVHGVHFEDRDLDAEDGLRNAHRHDLAMQGGVLREACAALYARPDQAGSGERAP